MYVYLYIYICIVIDKAHCKEESLKVLGCSESCNEGINTICTLSHPVPK